MTASDLNFLDVTFGFSVTSLGQPIENNSLALTAYSFSGNGGLIAIIEDVADSYGSPLGQKYVAADNLLGKYNLFDSRTFSPTDRIFAVNNILVASDDFDNFVSLDGFDQRFSQVPEPSTIILLGVGIAGGAFLYRRKRADLKCYRC